MNSMKCMRNMRNINFKRKIDVKCFSSDTVSSSGTKTTKIETDGEKSKLNTVTELFEQQGREFDADTKLIPKENALIFPQVKGSTLNSVDVSLYEDFPADAKLVCLSVKHYGFMLVRSWIDPFAMHFNPCARVDNEEEKNKAEVAKDSLFNSSLFGDINAQETLNKLSEAEIINMNKKVDPEICQRIKCVEICIIEFSILSMVSGIFAKNISKNVLSQQSDSTFLKFGGLPNFAKSLNLENLSTGYAYLLDKDNKIRWRGSGMARGREVARLFELTEELLKEADGLGGNGKRPDRRFSKEMDSKK